MSFVLTPTKTPQGWVVTMPPEMAQQAEVAEGSHLIVHVGQGKDKVEIIPPATAEMKESVRAAADKFKDLFAELKRRGD
jgi:hypothetical protein